MGTGIDFKGRLFGFFYIKYLGYFIFLCLGEFFEIRLICIDEFICDLVGSIGVSFVFEVICRVRNRI